MTTVPPPATPAAEAWLARVQALLAKAESTDFPEEAEALMAKAQALMARHAIDEALLAAAGQVAADAVVTTTVVVAAPYASAKTSLLASIARANDCRTVRTDSPKGTQHCTVVGHESDIANVRTLFAALSLHAVRAMLAAPVPEHDTPRRFRHAFLLAFAGRIGERLRAAAAEARTEAEASGGSRAGVGGTGRVGLVLANRQREVERALEAAFPHLRTARVSSSSGAGWQSGRRAADRAGLGGRGIGGSPRALGSG